MRIERRAQLADETRQRIFEIAIFALAESVPRHVDVAAEMFLVRIKRGNIFALLRRKQFLQSSGAEGVKIGADRTPVVVVDAPFDGLRSRDFLHDAHCGRQRLQARNPAWAASPPVA